MSDLEKIHALFRSLPVSRDRQQAMYEAVKFHATTRCLGVVHTSPSSYAFNLELDKLIEE